MGEVWCASNLRHLSVPHASLRRLLAPENARGAVAQRANSVTQQQPLFWGKPLVYGSLW